MEYWSIGKDNIFLVDSIPMLNPGQGNQYFNLFCKEFIPLTQYSITLTLHHSVNGYNNFLRDGRPLLLSKEIKIGKVIR